MRPVHMLTRRQLLDLASRVQQLLFLDHSPEQGLFWNPDKAWEGADVCAQLAALLEKYDLIPAHEEDFQSHKPERNGSPHHP